MDGELRFKLKPVDDRRRLRWKRLDSFTERESVFKTAVGGGRRFIESLRFRF